MLWDSHSKVKSLALLAQEANTMFYEPWPSVSILVVLLSVTGSGAANRSRLRHSHPGGAISGVMTWGQTPSRQNKYTQPHNIAQPAWAPQLLKGGGQLLTIQRSQDRA